MQQDAIRLKYIVLGWRHTLFCHVCRSQDSQWSSRARNEAELLLQLKHDSPKGNPHHTCPTASCDLPLPPLHHYPLFPRPSQLRLLLLSSLPKGSCGNAARKKGAQLRRWLLPWPVNYKGNFSPWITVSMNESLGMPQKSFSLHL